MFILPLPSPHPPPAAMLLPLSANGSPWVFADWWSEWLGPAGVVALAVGLVIASGLVWALNLITLPGNWIAIALLALWAWLGPSEGRLAVGWVPLALAFLLALAGELVEFMAGAVGASRAGASRRSTLFSLIGSITGAVLGAVIGLPIPLFGPILAAVLFGGLGATAGAMYGEWTSGRPWRENWSIGHAAFWGRTLGTLGKASLGLGIVAITLLSLLL